jgi:excisionase family DNA binding protein
MQKIKIDFEFPVVIKRIGPYLTFSVPDLGLSEKVLAEADTHACAEQDFLLALNSVISQAQKHINTKKWIPKTSTIKQTLTSQDADLSLPEFCQRLKKHLNISENTIRREIAKGHIISSFTSGGHRRIPESEITRYLNQIQCVPLVASPNEDKMESF